MVEDFVLKRINQLLETKGWSSYRLAEEAGLTKSTLPNARIRNTTPGMSTIVAVCKAFNITLSQFFNTEDDIATILSPYEKELLEQIRNLNDADRGIVLDLCKLLSEKSKRS